jgi:hypothetical protein
MGRRSGSTLAPSPCASVKPIRCLVPAQIRARFTPHAGCRAASLSGGLRNRCRPIKFYYGFSDFLTKTVRCKINIAVQNISAFRRIIFSTLSRMKSIQDMESYFHRLISFKRSDIQALSAGKKKPQGRLCGKELSFFLNELR